jgi:hypothetical protein
MLKLVPKSFVLCFRMSIKWPTLKRLRRSFPYPSLAKFPKLDWKEGKSELINLITQIHDIFALIILLLIITYLSNLLSTY